MPTFNLLWVKFLCLVVIAASYKLLSIDSLQEVFCFFFCSPTHSAPSPSLLGVLESIGNCSLRSTQHFGNWDIFIVDPKTREAVNKAKQSREAKAECRMRIKEREKCHGNKEHGGSVIINTNFHSSRPFAVCRSVDGSCSKHNPNIHPE